MKVVVLDYESFFDSKGGYTLKKMSTEAYIRDPRFEAHGAAIKWSPNHEAKWYDEKELRYVLKEEDWSDVFMINHHAQFDSLILSHHYDVHPAKLGCTLSMARLLLGNHLSVSLDSVRKHYGMPGKKTPYHLFDGKHWNEIEPAYRQEIADGACDEVESIWTLFNVLLKDFPREELQIVDTTMKMFTKPVLRADVNLLAQVWEREEKSKQTRMAALGVTATELQSADKFAELLRAEGVDPEYKQGKNGPIYSFAKTDDFMRELLEDENDRIRALAECRLGVKSTGLQTRAETLGFMAGRGPMPVYLRYAGASTLRFSGGDNANWQNFKRGSDIRRAIMAPEGHLLAPIDLSQVECRVLNYLAGQDDVVEKFRDGQDPYIGIASQFYGRQITKADPDERGTGKQAELSCGYGCAGPKFKATAKLGIYGPPVDLPLDDANRMVALYRQTHQGVTNYWRTAGRMLARLAGGDPLQWGPLTIKDHRIYLPNGCAMIYDTIEYHRPAEDEECKEFERNGYWRYRTRQGWRSLWGSKLTQHICEAVSRVIMTQAMIRITALGFRVVNSTHDELLVLLKKDGHEQHNLQKCVQEMKRTPDWLPGIPLDAEAHLGSRYEK